MLIRIHTRIHLGLYLSNDLAFGFGVYLDSLYPNSFLDVDPNEWCIRKGYEDGDKFSGDKILAYAKEMTAQEACEDKNNPRHSIRPLFVRIKRNLHRAAPATIQQHLSAIRTLYKDQWAGQDWKKGIAKSKILAVMKDYQSFYERNFPYGGGDVRQKNDLDDCAYVGTTKSASYESNCKEKNADEVQQEQQGSKSASSSLSTAGLSLSLVPVSLWPLYESQENLQEGFMESNEEIRDDADNATESNSVDDYLRHWKEWCTRKEYTDGDRVTAEKFNLCRAGALRGAITTKLGELQSGNQPYENTLTTDYSLRRIDDSRGTDKQQDDGQDHENEQEVEEGGDNSSRSFTDAGADHDNHQQDEISEPQPSTVERSPPSTSLVDQNTVPGQNADLSHSQQMIQDQCVKADSQKQARSVGAPVTINHQPQHELPQTESRSLTTAPSIVTTAPQDKDNVIEESDRLRQENQVLRDRVATLERYKVGESGHRRQESQDLEDKVASLQREKQVLQDNVVSQDECLQQPLQNNQGLQDNAMSFQHEKQDLQDKAAILKGEKDEAYEFAKETMESMEPMNDKVAQIKESMRGVRTLLGKVEVRYARKDARQTQDQKPRLKVQTGVVRRRIVADGKR
ncbi:hypothetical protein BGX29_001623 [Mortierella sp. GBA35]|nr:hypothetical protein BGX29_001623 [Mortierella sp. GBA35]